MLSEKMMTIIIITSTMKGFTVFYSIIVLMIFTQHRQNSKCNICNLIVEII